MDDKERKEAEENRRRMVLRERAKAAREAALKRHEEMNYCETCDPDTVSSKFVEGKGAQCAHGKTIPKRV